MSLKHPSLLAALMLGTSMITLGTGATVAVAQDNGGAPFGAPPVPVEASSAAGDTMIPSQGRTAAAAASWLPPRTKTQQADVSPVGGSANPAEPNLSALRFYAGQNDLARVAAEIRLLRAKYPGWEPPTDLFTDNRGGESEQPLWDLFGKHNLAGLKEAIAQRQQQTPGWQPSSDLTGKLAAAEAYGALVEASDRKDYGTVVDIASGNRGLMACGTIDAVWRTAEALALTDDEPHALEAYRFILTQCQVPAERLATVQKASLLIKSPEAIDGLMRMGKRLPSGASEFAEIRLDGLRQRIGDAASGKTLVQPGPGDIDQLAVRARTTGGGKDAELLGWYSLSRKDYAGAEMWFRTAMQPSPTPKAAEGLVLALRDGGKMPEAVTLAPQYASLGPPNRKLMMEVLVANLADAKQPPSAEQLAGLGSAIDAEKSADAAQSFGWSRFKANDVAGAEIWFRKSLDWQPNEAAAVGLMLTAKRFKHGADYAAVVSQYKALYPRVAQLDSVMKGSDRRMRQAPHGGGGGRRVALRGERVAKGDNWDKSATAIVQTFESGNLDQALAMMDARRSSRPEPRGLSVVRGWALYKKGDWDAAKQVFNDVGHRGMADEANKGLRQIELGYINPRFR